MSHRVGSIEEGKDADIIIPNGNPFDFRTYVDYTLTKGEILYDTCRYSPHFLCVQDDEGWQSAFYEWCEEFLEQSY